MFVLHDVMDDDYADIAEMVAKSEAACRHMVHRARERLTSRRRRFLVDDSTRLRMMEKFIAAANRDDRDRESGQAALARRCAARDSKAR